MLPYLVSFVLMLMATMAEAGECGVSGYKDKGHLRIVGGRDAAKNEYPWQGTALINILNYFLDFL